MRNNNLIYKYGHFFSADTGERINLKEGAQYALQGDDDDFLPQDPVNIPFSELPNEKEKLAEILAIPNLKEHQLALIRGYQLDLVIERPWKKQGIQFDPRTFCFVVRTLEELYVIKEGSEDALPSFADCKCVIESCLRIRQDPFEPIFANSLSEAYRKVIYFYLASDWALKEDLSHKWYFSNTDHSIDILL